MALRSADSVALALFVGRAPGSWSFSQYRLADRNRSG